MQHRWQQQLVQLQMHRWQQVQRERQVQQALQQRVPVLRQEPERVFRRKQTE